MRKNHKNIMREEDHRRLSSRDRLRNNDFIAFWLTSNKQPGYLPATNHISKAVHFGSHDSIANSSSTSSSDSSLIEEPKYLNGGYGWVVVGFSFILHFVADGLSFSFGVLFPKIQERFGAKRFGASSVASLFLSLPLLLGPVAGFVTDVCDCKRTILIGGIICCAGAISSHFCQSILMFTLCFGGLIGIGLSLVYNAAIVIVTYNFELRRGLATALAVSGTGVGTIVFPVFLKQFIPETGTDIGPAVIAISFVLSLIIIIGIVVRDVEWQSDTPEYKMKVFHRRLKKLRMDEESMKSREWGVMFQDVEVRRACSLPSLPSFFRPFMHKLEFNAEEVKDAVSTLKDHPTRSRSVGTFMNRQRATDALPAPEFSMLGGQLQHLEHLNLHLDNSPCTTVHCKPKPRVQYKNALSMDAIDNVGVDTDQLITKLRTENETNSQEPLENYTSGSDSEMSNDGDSSSSDLSDTCLNKTNISNNIAPTAPLKLDLISPEPALPMSARLLRSSLAPGLTGNRIPAGNVPRYRGPSNLIAYQGKAPSAPTLADRKKRRNLFAKLHLKEVGKGMYEEMVLYRLLLSESSFVLFLISVTSLYFVLDVPYVFFYDFAIDKLKTEESSAAWLTSIIGVANLFSTWICGVFSDAYCVKTRLFTVYGIAMCGLSLCMWLVTIVSSTLEMALICACFGFFISSNYVLQSVMLTTMWEDMRNFQTSYALTSFCEGIATLFGPPVIGYIRDNTGSYKLVFVVSGFLCLTSAILSFTVQVIINRRNKKTRHL
ncbi:hypothetical protein Q1695_001099 [Nippostrongylus brasiliensis]|nr:hypothetical protein Q1695_001099 [Nippostrongylus brasiliensis]